MGAEIEYEITGYVCECCVSLHYNGECSHDYIEPGETNGCSARYMLTGDYTLDVDLEHPHFGHTCIVCRDHALAGERYDCTVTGWK